MEEEARGLKEKKQQKKSRREKWRNVFFFKDDGEDVKVLSAKN